MLNALLVPLLFSFITGIEPDRPSTAGSFEQGGVNLYFDAADFDHPRDLPAKLERTHRYLVDLNVNAVSIVWPLWMDGVWGETILRRDGLTPSDYVVEKVVRFFVRKGYHVTMRPILNEDRIMEDGRTEWRGTIRPRDTARWFAGYTELLRDYAEIADKTSADVLTVGTELDSMESYHEEWERIIETVRGEFSGEVTYASNRRVSPNFPWQFVDFISVDAFFRLELPIEATADEIAEALYSEWWNEVFSAAARYGLPVVFAEVGTRAEQGSFNRPWIWDHRTPRDQSAQANYYQANCIAWGDLRGLYWWHISLDPPDDADYRGFRFQGNDAAEAAVRDCFRNPS